MSDLVRRFIAGLCCILLWAAHGESPAAIGRRCLPAGDVAPLSNVPDIPGRRALPAGCLAGLGATPDFSHGLLGTGSPAHGQPAGTTDEQRLKAAFVYRFAQFVEWPPEALADRTSLEICVSAPSTYGAALNELVAGESLGGRPIVVREVEAKDTLESCHLLFALPAPGGDKATLLPRAAPLPILTVGDDPTFLEDGGIINLRIIDRSVRFEINTAAAERAGLRLSSQLLRLAVKIVDGTP